MDFDSAPSVMAKILSKHAGVDMMNSRLLRDVYGKLSFVTKASTVVDPDKLEKQIIDALGPYSAGKGEVLVFGGTYSGEFDDLFSEPAIVVSFGTSETLKMLDRRIAGEDWLNKPVRLAPPPLRIVFHSVKGGVGRSTALAVAAADLSSRGYNVLVVDLDLEAPGLGSLLLLPNEIPKYGVVDWYAAAAAGADTASLIPEIIGTSPFTSGRSIVDVVPACGGHPQAYLSKLARAYVPGSAGQEFAGVNFAGKANCLISALSARRPYDAILIDARAGLHETSGALLLGLGAQTLLFGVDTPQTFDDYALLFGGLAQALSPDTSGYDLRTGFKMVHGKAPRDVGERQSFRERSWNLWSEQLYDDDVSPDAEIGSMVFDLTDETAPHFPLEIVGDDSYARFNPRSETYSLSSRAYEPIFGDFLSGLRLMLELK